MGIQSASELEKVINKSIKTRMKTERKPDKVRNVKMRTLMTMMRMDI